jgi:integrase
LCYNDVTEMDATMVEQGLSIGTRRNTIVCFRSILSGAHEAGKLPTGIPKLPRLPKLGRTVLKTLTKEQVEKLLAAAHPQGRLAMGLAAYAGLRAGEVRALT